MRKLALPFLFAILAAVATCTGARAYVGTQLDAIALLTPTNGNVITGNGSTWTSAANSGASSWAGLAFYIAGASHFGRSHSAPAITSSSTCGCRDPVTRTRDVLGWVALGLSVGALGVGVLSLIHAMRGAS